MIHIWGEELCSAALTVPKALLKKIWCSKRHVPGNVCVNAENLGEFFGYEQSEKVSRWERGCLQSCKEGMELPGGSGEWLGLR